MAVSSKFMVDGDGPVRPSPWDPLKNDRLHYSEVEMIIRQVAVNHISYIQRM